MSHPSSEPVSSAGPAVLTVQLLAVAGGDAEELEQLTALLRSELLDLDVAAVEPLTAEQAPEDVKGALADLGGWLGVYLGPAALRSVVNIVAGWAARNTKIVEVSLGGDVLKLTGVSSDQQIQVINEWFARQAPRA